MSTPTLHSSIASTPTQSSAISKVVSWFSGTLGLARVDARSAAPLAAGLVLFALVGLAAARFGFGIPLPTSGFPHFALITAVAVAAAIPITAQLMEADWRDGTARAIQSAPARLFQVLWAKLCCGVVLVGAVWLLLAAADRMLVFAFPQEVAEDPLTAVFAWGRFYSLTFWFGWVGITVTATVAVVVRHALVATLVGGVVAIAPMITMAIAAGPSVDAWSQPNIGLGAKLGFSATTTGASMLFIGLLYSLRGKRARSVWRRGTMATAMLLSLVSAPLAMALSARALAPALTLTDPDAWVDFSNTSLHPDGSCFTLQLGRSGNFDHRKSTWVVDSKTFEATLLPSAVDELHRLTAPTFDSCGATWSWDGTAVLGSLQRGDKHFEQFSIDIATGSVREVQWAEFSTAVNDAGWTFERSTTREEKANRTVQAWRDDSTDEPIELPCWRAPIVPTLAPHLLFYTASSGEVRRLDTTSGEDVALGLVNEDDQALRTSPSGHWLSLYAGKGKSTLLETATGRHAVVNAQLYNPLDGEWPILKSVHRTESRWRRANLDAEEVFKTEMPVIALKQITPDLYVGHDHPSQHLYVFDRQGRLVKTLR